jgi:basic membrane protein A
VAEGINREAWTGLVDARAAGILDRIDRIETVDARDRGPNIAALADAGYDAIITVGSSISSATKAAATNYPAVYFVAVGQSPDGASANLAELVFHEEQSGYLAGTLAAAATSTGRVAAVCEARFVDSVRRYCDGFQAGVEAMSPTVRASVTYRQGATDRLFRDAAWGKATALREIEGGADILFAAGGETADAALGAAASERAMVIGSETDLYVDRPALRPYLLSSAISDIPDGVVNLLRMWRQGQRMSGEYFGRVELAPFHALQGKIGPELGEELSAIQMGLETGTIPAGVPYVKP